MKIGIEPKNLVRKIEKTPQVYKAVITLVVVLLVVGALFYFIAIPQREERDKLAKEHSELQKEVSNLQQIERNLEKHRKEFAQMKEVLQDVMRQLPEGKDIPNLLRNITSISEESRLKIKFFEPKESRNKEFYAELPFEIKFVGTFHNVAYFFDGIRKMERLVNISNFSLEAKGTRTNVVLDGSCSAVAYMYSKEPAKTAKSGKQGAKGGKDAKK